MSKENPFGEVISQYTRKQAFLDGVLIDLSVWAEELGFKFPVACTAKVWHEWIVPPTELVWCQSERGRAHDVLWMLLMAIRVKKSNVSEILYKVMFQQTDTKHETIQLKSVCGPGDDAEPIITIMMPDED
ncbi:MAG: hypothetical protein CMB80_00955 [Flammeovirgaceae bacterium]|nr:hypothetical protein [Flammeovirgaceae bacterium]